MSNLDDLRGLTADNDDSDGGLSFDGFDDDEFPVSLGQEIGADGRVVRPKKPDGRILGLTAPQRAFFSVMLLVNILLLGVALMVVTGRLSI